LEDRRQEQTPAFISPEPIQEGKKIVASETLVPEPEEEETLHPISPNPQTFAEYNAIPTLTG
jgi:hypothetical protein